MRTNNTYILQLLVKKCKINVQQSGSVGLLLRAGKNQSHVTNLQPIINGVVNFNTPIKLNVDDSALDTKRCTLTLNFVSALNTKKVIGIVVATLPQIGTQTEKTLKVTSTPDKEAEIDLIIGLREVNENKNVEQQQKSIKQTQKQSQKQKSIPTMKNGGGLLGSMMSINSKNQQSPTSPPSYTTQKLNLKSKRSQIQSIGQTQQLQITIQRLQKQKQLLKQLLRLQMTRSMAAYTHLKNIIQVLQTSTGFNFGSGENLRSTTGGQNSGLSKKYSVDGFDLGKGALSLSTPGLGNSGLTVVKESRFEDFSPNPQSKIKDQSKFKSDISSISKTASVGQILNELRSRVDQVGRSKNELAQIFEKIKVQPKVQLDASKLRMLKNRIDKSYLQLLNKQPLTKEQILKQKIDVNKILDQVINPTVK